ncbi:MAG: nucleotide exchange factor GrpE [Nitrospinae bacterium]|nr:nucleotide exchange factor GrpE [Nitrospinota bacterium]
MNETDRDPAPTDADQDDFTLPPEPGEPLEATPLPEPVADEVTLLRAQVENLQKELQQREGEFRDLNDKALRALADADNYKKRLVREGEEARKYAALNVVRGLLPALENFEKAVQAVRMENADLATLRTGVGMVYQQLMDHLKSEGLEKLDVVGKPFDPELCEALGIVPSDTVSEGDVAVELMPGYRFKDRVLRHAKVQIAAPKPATPASEG